jgi:hypothetical protein
MFADRYCNFRKVREGEDGRDKPGHDGVGESIISALDITPIKSQITPIRIVWRFAQDRRKEPREAH